MRRKEREIIEEDILKKIIEEAHVVHIGLIDDPYPYVVPVNYGYKWDEANRLILYIHGARQGKKVTLIQKNPHVCIQIDKDSELITAEKSAPKYSFAYQSIIGFGHAVILDNIAEKEFALDALMMHETKKSLVHFDPIPKHVIEGTGIIKITIESLTGKERKK